ncbi:MAG: hypothetical protein B7X90_03135 [Novosphingobium sp. 17-62-19]|uniref:hypothetical protein n=1 Tax=Novosphingobium sp. 17-62-19 TaxID=1970406 RepID=UPI000BC8DC8E|nr:hypothetical protein [Novosphingobium sp. 17-62-19]OZA21117.1 MAG: hypothetical protein B7X90_03135 [Novosphingobium sp. 17-62-19]HQS95320.1 hypothetical protein [Novosphingobium sp.]
MDASDRSADCAPFAALVYDPPKLPTLADIEREVMRGSAFSVSHSPDVLEGWAEILRDGLTFDLRGLAGGPPRPLPEVKAGVGAELARFSDMAALTLYPGPHLAGAQRLLPVIRVAANLLIDLARIGPANAVAWLPARLLIRMDLFERAVRPWLEGGPFPAPAFVALHANSSGGLRTEGLNFFIEQEFSLQSQTETGIAQLPRVAIRLIDWLVAHGPVSIPTEAVLAGTGAVFLEVQDKGLILARCD